MAMAAVCCTAVAIRESATDAGDGLDCVLSLGVTPAFSKSCDCVAEEDEKGLSSSGVAGVEVLGVSPKPVLLPDEEDDEGSMGTS